MKNLKETMINDVLRFIDTSKRTFFTKMNIKSFSNLATNHPDQLNIVLQQLVEDGKIIEISGGASENGLGRVPGYEIIK